MITNSSSRYRPKAPGSARAQASIATGARPESGRPLGIYAKTESAPAGALPSVDPLTGEILGGTPVDHRSARAQRYALKSVVNRLLPVSRTSKCMRWHVPKQALQIHKSDTNGRAFYSGLQVCASVWACPVCAAKISERRRVELLAAIERAKVLGLDVYLVTLTVPHGLGDDVRQVLDGILSAWRKSTTSRAGKKFRADFGIRGTVRALEVTYGANGFHPHIHALLFLDRGGSPSAVQRAFSPLWQYACEKAGLPRPSFEHGCRVDDGSHAGSYAAKWGLDSEMTKSHMKKGKNGGSSPWDFLRNVLDKGDGYEKSAALFRVYADAFKGRRQLYWSNGLRDFLALGVDATDEEVAAAQEDNAHVLSEISVDQWRAILGTKTEAAVLTMAEDHPLILPTLIDSIHKMFLRRGAVSDTPRRKPILPSLRNTGMVPKTPPAVL